MNSICKVRRKVAKSYQANITAGKALQLFHEYHVEIAREISCIFASSVREAALCN